MNNALATARNIYIDTNIFIYFIEGSEELQEKIDSIFNIVDESNISLFTSDITIAECLYGPYRANQPRLAAAYQEMFDTPGFVRLISVNASICIAAAQIGARNRLKLIDAIHVSSALSVGCDVFLTNDTGIRSTDKLSVVQLTDWQG